MCVLSPIYSKLLSHHLVDAEFSENVSCESEAVHTYRKRDKETKRLNVRLYESHTLWERAGVCTVCLGQLPYRYQLVEKWTVPLRQDDAILHLPALQLILYCSISPSGANIATYSPWHVHGLCRGLMPRRNHMRSLSKVWEYNSTSSWTSELIMNGLVLR